MDWFRSYRGCSTDPKLLLVMRQTGADGMQVLGALIAMHDYAAQAKPRGSVVGFPVEAYSAFAGVEPSTVRRIVDALANIGVHDGVVILRWDDAQPTRFDPTCAERQRRYRAKQGKTKTAAPVADDELNTSRNVTGNVTSDVTRNNAPRREKSEAILSSDSSIPVQPSIASLSTRAARAMKVGEVWTELEQLGLPVASFRRMFHTTQIREWVDAGITPADLADAIQRARAARQRANDPSPLNVGFLSRFVADVLGGQPATATRSKGHGAVDAAADAFLAGR